MTPERCCWRHRYCSCLLKMFFRLLWRFVASLHFLQNYVVLTHYSPVFLFYTPWKYQKTLRFSDVFRGYRKATRGCNGLNKELKEREKDGYQVLEILEELKNDFTCNVSRCENNCTTKKFRMKSTVFKLSNRISSECEIEILE